MASSSNRHPLLLSDNSRVLGSLLLGAPGSGKTIFLSLLLLIDLLRGLGGVVLDPTGTLTDAFLYRLLCFLSYIPLPEHARVWERVRYTPLGHPDYVFPIYQARPGETLRETAERLVTVLELAHPNLVNAPITWPKAKRLGVNAGMILAALGYPLTKIEDLLLHPADWDKSGKFDAVIRLNTQDHAAVSYFLDFYLPLPRFEKSQIMGTLLDHIYMLISDPKLIALFSGGAGRRLTGKRLRPNDTSLS